MMNKNALIIGCGNIGALYDFENNDITTHAKALYLTNNFNLFFYDNDTALANRVAEKYNGSYISDISDNVLQSSYWVSLCSPTPTHFFYLERLLQLENIFILCEKPVSNNLQELEKLGSLYENSSSVIYVNYMRRFQESYIDFKRQHAGLLSMELLRECTVNYCRGFINNASHAFDLLEFLFDSPINLENIRISKKVYDVFNDDPTVSMTACWKSSKIILEGHVNISKPVFEIRMRFENFSIEFLNSGNDILVKTGTDEACTFNRKGCLNNYMKNVIAGCNESRATKDKSNFIPSVNLNKKLLGYIKNN